MQPWYEHVAVPPDRSWRLFDRRLPAFAFNWHYHPEYELTLTLNSRGLRFVGDHVARYDEGDLVLVGPDVPHAWQSEALIDPAGEHRAIVCWFTRAWVEGALGLMPELHRLRALLAAAGRGLRFGAGDGAAQRRLLGLLSQAPEQQVLGLLGLLLDLAGQAGEPLASGEMAISASNTPRDRERMARVLDWLHVHYAEPLRLAPLLALVHLSESQLQRLFQRSARMSLSAYVNQLRIAHASRLLVQTGRQIGQIATEVGFSDAAHLGRQFRAAKGMAAGAYRALYQCGRESSSGGGLASTE